MVYAAVVQVKVEPDSDIEHRHAVLSDFVVPETKSLGGFQRAMWLNDGAGMGTCIVVFDTKDNAKAAIAVLTRPGGPPVLTSGVHEVEMET
jgi:hypothetical protein